MFRRTYKVKGTDVNDFMIMQEFAYHSYASSILTSFLFEKGFSKSKLNSLKINFQRVPKKTISYTPLLFTQHFTVSLEFLSISEDKRKMQIQNRFFNNQNKLCATVCTEISCFQNNSHIITAPKPIIEQFQIRC